MLSWHWYRYGNRSHYEPGAGTAYGGLVPTDRRQRGGGDNYSEHREGEGPGRR